MNPNLENLLKQLRLSGLAASLEIRLAEAAGNRLSHAEFLELILQDELGVRRERLIARRLKQAAFRDQKTLEDFNWSFNSSIPRKQVYDLAAGGFLREARDVLFLGPPGTGKSHLVQAIGYAVIKAGFAVLYRSIFDVVRDFLHDEALGGEDKVLARYLKPDLVIIDDMGMKQLPLRINTMLMNRRRRLFATVTTRSLVRRSRSFVASIPHICSFVCATMFNSPSRLGCSIPSPAIN